MTGPETTPGPPPPRSAGKFRWKRPLLYKKQFDAIFNPARIVVIEASTKSGKAQPLDSVIWTPTGPSTMGAMEPGMVVLTPTGRAAVESVHPQGEQDVYRVSFSDRSSVECTLDHLWEVSCDRRCDRVWAGPRVVTLGDILQVPEKLRRRLRIPIADPVDFDAQATPLPIDPYLLGQLLGNGSLSGDGAGFSTGDAETIVELTPLLPAGHTFNFYGRYDYRITAGKGAAQQREDGTGIVARLRSLGLTRHRSETKFIPALYRYNTVAVRLAVLQGLLDSDGTVGRKDGQPDFSTASPQLATDLVELVESLGGSALRRLKAITGYRKNGVFTRCLPSHGVAIRHKDAASLFRLTRKRDLCQPKKKPVTRHFREIEFVGRKPCQCIALDDQRGLYLTDRFIATHNTSGCAVWLLEQAFHGKPGQNFWWVAPTAAVARISFRRIKRVFLRHPKSVTINRTALTIELPNGTTVWFKSADNADSLFGEDVFAAVIDECSRVSSEAWYAVRSTLTATSGKIRLIGNVKGRRNWAYQLARKAEQGEHDMAYAKLTIHDAVAAGIVPPEEVEAARRDLPVDVFNELYLAIPSEDGSNPFGMSYIRGCAILPTLAPGPPVVWGWDLAKVRDWTVGIGLNHKMQVCAFHRWQKNWPITQAEIGRLIGRIPALIDATGVGAPIVDGLIAASTYSVEGFIFTNRSKQALMEWLAVLIQNLTVQFPGEDSFGDARMIAMELGTFEYQHTRGGVTYTAPAGLHDDAVCALALACKHFAVAQGILTSLVMPVVTDLVSPFGGPS